MLDLDVKLYDRNLASPTFDSNLTGMHSQMKFSTRLHGGFYTCSFRLKMDVPQAWEWITKKMFYRLVIADGKQILWEGRIQDIGLDAGGVTIGAYGYYANLGDIPYTTAYNGFASVVIKAVLTANCAQISSDQSNIDALDITITSAANASYLDIYLRDIVEKLLDFSDSTSKKWYFAIWENRVPYLKARLVSTVKWTATLADFTMFQLKHQGGDLYNSVYARYWAAGALTRTAIANNTDSQIKYGDGTNNLIRRFVTPDLGEVAAATAQAQRDAELANRKEIYPRLTNMTLGNQVFDANGAAYPSAWVRAGDVFRVKDLVPESANIAVAIQDTLRTYYLVETEYDVDKGQLKIIPDTENSSLSAILAKKLRLL